VGLDFLTTPLFHNHSPVLISGLPANDTMTAMPQVFVREKHVTTTF
jgi:hypothetical protein